jgi:hypothetical protein
MYPPNYGTGRVSSVPSTSTGVAGVVGLGKHVGRTPADRRGAGSNRVRVRRGRS